MKERERENERERELSRTKSSVVYWTAGFFSTCKTR